MGKLAGTTPSKPRQLKKADLERAAIIDEFFRERGVDLVEIVELADETGGGLKLEGGTWTTPVKLKNGTEDELVHVENKKGSFKLTVDPFSDGPRWPYIEPGPAVTIKQAKPPKRVKRSGGEKLTMMIPDIQAPFHDVDACELVLEMARVAQPDEIVMNGDNLDFAALSRFKQFESFQQGTQESIDFMTVFCARLRAACPHASIVWLAGNHEDRINSYVLANAAALRGVTVGKLPGEEDDEHRPVLSIDNLCQLHASGVEYLEGYPATQYWVRERPHPNPLRIIHGYRHGVNAQRDYLNEGVSTGYGHIHHRRWEERVQPDGRRIVSVTPGALCRTDGYVPGYLTGYDGSGNPVHRPTNFDQGVAFFTTFDDDERIEVEMCPIERGETRFRGERLKAS